MIEKHSETTNDENHLNTAVKEHHSYIVRRLASSVLLNSEEIEYLENLQTNTMSLKKNEYLIQDGDIFEFCYIVRDGWLMRWRETGSGRRQIVNIYLPGDVIALQVNFDRRAIFNISALVPVEVAAIEPARILDIYRAYPVLASGLDWATVRNLNIVSEHNISLGARPADHRILQMMLEFWCRLMMSSDVQENGFELPLSQRQLGDLCGLSLVHTNKTLAGLRKKALVEINDGIVGFPDVDAAMKYCDFDDRFLQNFQLPRQQNRRQMSS